ILSHDASTGIETAFSLEASFGEGRIFQGFFSFTTEYRNSLMLLGEEFSLQMDPAFTIGPTAESNIAIRSKNQTVSLRIPPSDMFRSYLSSVISSIKSQEHARWAEVLRQDASAFFRAALISGAL